MLVLRLAAVVGLSTMCAKQLAGQEIRVIADTLTVLDILTPARKNFVRAFPDFLRDQSGDNLACLVLVHHPVFLRQKFLLLGEHIDDAHLVANIITLIFRV